MVEDVIGGVHVRQGYPCQFLLVLVVGLLLGSIVSPLALPVGLLVSVLCLTVRTLRRSDGELVVVRVVCVAIGRQRMVVLGCRISIVMMVGYFVRGEMQIVIVIVLVVEGAER